jgi:flagellar basal-body rod protein FlgG
MPDGAAIAAASMSLDAERVRIISQNFANMLTPGYKRALPVAVMQPAFGNALASAAGTANPVFTLAPLPAVEHTIDFREAPSRHTGNALDLAIEGAGFFELHGASGTHYTRQGSFGLDANGMLIGSNGEHVAGVDGDIHLESAAVIIDRQGRIFDPKGTQVAQIKLVRFDNPAKLSAIDGGRYMQGSAQIRSDGPAALLRQGALETSNVNSAYEMVKLIESVRHYQSGGQVIRAYDQMLDKALSKLGEF